MVTTDTTDRLFAEFDQLRSEFLSSGARRAPMSLVQSKEQPESEPRRGLAEIEVAVRQIIDVVQQFSVYVALASWLVQVLYNRKVKYKVLIAQVIGLLRGWGLVEAETTLLRNLARQELIRLGLPEAKAEWGSTQVLEALVRELPPDTDTDEPVAMRQLLEHIRELVAYSQTWEFEEVASGCRVKVRLPDERRQRVHIRCGRKDSAGRPLVEFLSLCGKVGARSLEQVLRKSNDIEFGTYTIRQGIDREGNEFATFVLQYRVPLHEVTQGLLAKVLPYLAAKADDLEADLLPRRTPRK